MRAHKVLQGILGQEEEDAAQDQLEAAVDAAKDGDTVPCADPGEGREGRDRETLALSQEDLVRKVLAANPRTVMVLVSSFPYAIAWSQQHVPAILHMAHSSQDEGWALAQVLFEKERVQSLRVDC